MNVKIVTYKKGITAVRQLRALFKFNKRLRPTHIINWGCSEHAWETFNTASSVRAAVNKIECLAILETAGVPHVECSTSIDAARKWARKHRVFARTRVRGRAGQGIIVVEPGQEVPSAKFYTKYFKAKYEFRVHVAFGEVIRVQQKKKLNQVPHNAVRSYANGYRYSTNTSIVVPDCVRDVGIRAVAALGLDFGAVDILYMESTNTCKVLEVNTAPGIEGDTVTAYYNAFVKEINNGRV